MKTLKEQYLENALKYAEAFKAIFEQKVDGGEYKKFSRMEKVAGKKCNELYFKIKEEGNLGELEEFLLHENPYVRYLAANHCLEINPQLAEKTLEELIESDDHRIQSHARTSLKAWRNIPWTSGGYK